jgi:hypothetical protein
VEKAMTFAPLLDTETLKEMAKIKEEDRMEIALIPPGFIESISKEIPKSEWDKYVEQNKGIPAICESCGSSTIVFDQTLPSVTCLNCGKDIDLK